MTEIWGYPLTLEVGRESVDVPLELEQGRFYIDLEELNHRIDAARCRDAEVGPVELGEPVELEAWAAPGVTVTIAFTESGS
jgi:hypothetical protein